MYDKAYYDGQKQEIQQEYQLLVNEIYSDIERLVVKKFEKAKLLGEKMDKIVAKEKESLEANKKSPEGKVVEPAKSKK